MDKKLKRKQGSSSQGELQAKPVLDASGQPNYPTHAGLPDDDDTRSGRWGKGAAGVATFFLAINIGGSAESQSTPKNLNPPVITQQAEQSSSRTSQQTQGTIVAPLFEHGEGRGSIGCVAVCPPAFLSEEEAMQVIKEELGKHGIKLGKGGELEGVTTRLPVPNIYGFKEDEGKKLKNPKTLHVDAKEQKKGIAIEFVSRSDLDALRQESRREKREEILREVRARFAKAKKKSAMDEQTAVFRAELSLMIDRSSTSRSYDMKSIAKYLAKEVAGKGKEKIYLGVFYDPAERPSLFDSEEERKRFLETMRALREDHKVPKETVSKKEEPKKTEKPVKEPEKRMTWEEREKRAHNESKKKLRQQVSDFATWLKKQDVEFSTKD